ncbi:MAG: type II secretion system F family protein [Candidatus Micrarchaeota archaeon]|nr:type II secretion system F family protein [Candidatus Micrarchaeota archaeon]
MRVKFLLFSIERAKGFNRRILVFGDFLQKVFVGTKYDLKKAELEITAEEYLTSAFISALFYGIIFFALGTGLLYLRDGIIESAFPLNIIIGLVFFVLFFFLHLIYPGIIAKKIAFEVDQNLIFALKSMLIQVKSGVPLFSSIKNVAKSDYGVVSAEFQTVVQEINSGTPEAKAIEKMALRTKSEYLRKAAWQIVSSIKSGASSVGALETTISTLTTNQLRAIKNYAAELNLWILMYLLLAAAIPTLGITFMIILSAMGGSNITETHVMLTIAFAFVIQVVLIGFVKNRKPKVVA